MEPQVVINALIALNAVQFLVIVLAVFRLERNIPPTIVEALFNIARRETAKTPQTWDDDAVERVVEIYNDLTKEQAQAVLNGISQAATRR